MTESWYLAFFALNIVFCFRLKSKDGFFVQITIYLYNKPNHNVSMNISQNSFLMNGCCFHKSFPSSDQIPETPPEASGDFFFNIHRSLIKCLRKKNPKKQKKKKRLDELKYLKSVFSSGFVSCFPSTPLEWPQISELFLSPRCSQGDAIFVYIPNCCPSGHSNPFPESQLARSSTCGS